VNQIVISKVYALINESERKNGHFKAQVLMEMNEKFKDLKQKMLKKLNSKNEEIQKYSNFFEDLDKRLGNLENMN